MRPSKVGVRLSAISDLHCVRSFGLAELRKDVTKHVPHLYCGWSLLLQFSHGFAEDGCSRKIGSIVNDSWSELDVLGERHHGLHLEAGPRLGLHQDEHERATHRLDQCERVAYSIQVVRRGTDGDDGQRCPSKELRDLWMGRWRRINEQILDAGCFQPSDSGLELLGLDLDQKRGFDLSSVPLARQ